MPNIKLEDIKDDIVRAVKIALEEDIGSGDITAELIPEAQKNTATIITREDCVLCGTEWVDEVFRQLGGVDTTVWHYRDGDQVKPNETLVTLKGNTRTLLTGERTALNFLQLLSGIATKSLNYFKLVENTSIKILDTRKTTPGLRLAQKYAVNIGGCHNHRLGLYDAFLLKENHIAACGGISPAVTKAREINPNRKVEVETETLRELSEAIECGADTVMLDNFSVDMLKQALLLDKKNTKFEISGNLSLDRIQELSNLTIDYCSIGDLTKNIKIIDLSMRIHDKTNRF